MNDLKGLSGVLQKLNKEISNIKNNINIGLTEATLVVKASAVEQTPIDTGNLRASAYTDVKDNKGYVGYTANYAFWVHEMPMLHKGEPRSTTKKRGNFWDGGNNQFLRNALIENNDRIIKILAKWAKVK